MAHRLSRAERDTYLAEKRLQVLTMMIHLLTNTTNEDVASFPPASRERLAAVLDRAGESLPTDTVERLRAALDAKEVAA